MGKLADPKVLDEESKSPAKKRSTDPLKPTRHNLYMASPILISLRALVHQNSEQKKKLVEYESVLQSILRLSLETFEDDNRGRLRNVHHSCNIIIGELAGVAGQLIKEELLMSLIEEEKDTVEE